MILIKFGKTFSSFYEIEVKFGEPEAEKKFKRKKNIEREPFMT